MALKCNVMIPACSTFLPEMCRYNMNSRFSLFPRAKVNMHMFQNDNESSKKFGLKNVDSSLLFFALLLTFMWLMRLIYVWQARKQALFHVLQPKNVFFALLFTNLAEDIFWNLAFLCKLSHMSFLQKVERKTRQNVKMPIKSFSFSNIHEPYYFSLKSFWTWHFKLAREFASVYQTRVWIEK